MRTTTSKPDLEREQENQEIEREQENQEIEREQETYKRTRLIRKENKRTK